MAPRNPRGDYIDAPPWVSTATYIGVADDINVNIPSALGQVYAVTDLTDIRAVPHVPYYRRSKPANFLYTHENSTGGVDQWFFYPAGRRTQWEVHPHPDNEARSLPLPLMHRPADDR